MLGDVTEPLPKVALAARRPGAREPLCAAPRHNRYSPRRRNRPPARPPEIPHTQVFCEKEYVALLSLRARGACQQNDNDDGPCGLVIARKGRGYRVACKRVLPAVLVVVGLSVFVCEAKKRCESGTCVSLLTVCEATKI